MPNNIPLTNFHFIVNWGTSAVAVSEVTGLQMELQVASYRDGSSPQNSFEKMPGIKGFTNVVIKRGLMKSNNDFYNWINTAQFSNVERRDVIISLLDATGSPAVVWKLSNAWPCRLAYYPMNAANGQVIIEELELAYENMTVQNN
jgi:phage tail-like protein